MKKIHLLLPAVLLLFTGKIHAQMDVELVNSGTILFEGALDYALGSYSKAEEVYKKVGANDTNYAEVSRDLALAYSADKEDSLCAYTCKYGLDLHTEYDPDFYNLLGNSLKEMGKYDSAFHVLDRAIKLYPYYYLFHYTKGMAYVKMNKYKEAQECFQDAVKLNPFHADSHFMLGKTCSEQGRMIPAILSYEFYLLLDAQSERSQKVVSSLEDMTTGDYQPDPDLKLSISEAGDDCFSDINDMIASGKAYDKSYKNKTKINLKLVKQMQMLFEQLKYKDGTGNWWMENYVPFFNALQAQNYFTPFITLSLAPVASNNTTVMKSFKKNKKKITEFSKWAVKYLKQNMKHPVVDLLSDKTNPDYTFNDDYSIGGVGHSDAKDNPVGEWIFFWEKCGAVFSKGSYNAQGNREGEWNTYYRNGQLMEKATYVNGLKEGPSEQYHENGLLAFKCTYTKDMVDGEYTTYAIHGGIKEKASMNKGVFEGDAFTYFSNGAVRASMHYKAGNLTGEFDLYTLDGKISSKTNYLMGKRNGTATEYFSNGKTKSEGDYKNDDAIDEWKIYFENGNIQREGMFKEAGNREGVWKEYYRNGKVSADATYKSGKYNGKVNQFDTDGVLYETDLYSSGTLKTVTYFDKSGGTIAEYEMKETTTVKEYFPNGAVSGEGDYVDGHRDGDWKIYSANGGWLRAKEHYRYGFLSGTRKEYFPNGTEKEESDYFYDSQDGYYKSWYSNGKLESEGNYSGGEKAGDWYYYNERGGFNSHKYYINGSEHGLQIFFDKKGRKNEEDFIKETFLWSRTRFDSTGAVIYKWESDNGTGKFDFPYPGGKDFVVTNYKDGYREGELHKYAFDGQDLILSNYINGVQFGVRKEFYPVTGKPFLETNMDYDNRNGSSNAWWENGNKRWEENYYDGDLNGMQKYYHENGQIFKQGTWEMGNVNGELEYYSDNGSLQYARYYKDGNVLGYSYPDKDGNLLAPMIKLKDGSGDFTGYYQNGDTSICGKYDNGKLTGHVVTYYPNGKISDDENYDHYDYVGSQKYYYSNGNLHKELNYFCDQLDGVQKYYYENGQLEHTEYYILGDNFGVWKFYSPAGQEIRSQTWYDDMQLAETITRIDTQADHPKKDIKKGGGK
ncbi:MAG: tetratricopeptide repeat protein [Bacteroidetes bacterium]|nr:tetratricopeptide repeat protein [Bacteroidota bacterium]